MTRILLAQEVDGKCKYAPPGISLLLGITGDPNHVVAKSVQDRFHRTGEVLPDFHRRMSRRAKEAMAATGSTNPAATLEYWAHTEGRGEIDFDEATGTVWLTLDDDGPP